MLKNQNIILIGPMGTGKTTIGKYLARKLAKTFYDSDHEIERHTGADIPLIFELEGEEGFRKRESTMLQTLLESTDIVLSTGGGAVLKPENRKLLSYSGTVIYLKSSVAKLYKRMSHDKQRPLLMNHHDRLSRIESLLQERQPIYLALADIIIDTERLSVKQITEKIVNLI